MYPSFFKFKRLVEHQDQCQNQREIENNNDNNNNNISISLHDAVSITNNLEEFKLLFSTQEKACYELRSENTVLKMKLEVANKMIQVQSKKIKSLKLKKNNLEIENNVYRNVLLGSSLLNHPHQNNNNNNSNKYIKNEDQEQSCNTTNAHVYAYPPPPPPPLPLPPPNKKKDSGNFLMDNLLDELKSKIKIID
jgi:hypothetical protein